MNFRGLVIIIAFFALICSEKSEAQPWLYNYYRNFKSTKDAVSFAEEQQIFNTYWKSQDVLKKRGYKQFRRWENIMEPRLNGAGSLNSLELWGTIEKQSTYPPSDSILWKFAGPDKTPYSLGSTLLTGNGRLNCIAFNPADSNIIYVGAPSGGLWISYDAGRSWTTSTDMLNSIGVSDIAVSYDNPSVMYLATGDGDAGDTYALGIIKSTDGGLTWHPTGLSLNVADKVYFRKIIMSPSDPDIMLATSSNGIYRTTNGWVSYTLVRGGSFKDIEFKPGDPSYVYATSSSSSGLAKIYRSTNGGLSFTETSAGLSLDNKVERIELAVTKANSNLVYALCSDASNSGFYAFYKSTNSGVTWTLVYDNQSANLLGWTTDGSDAGGQGWYDLALAVSPTNANTIFVGGVNIWKSTNGGSSWNIVGIWYYSNQLKYIHADQHAFGFSPFSNTFYTCNDGGLYRTYDLGKTWKDLSNDMQILQVYRLGTSKTNSGKIICGNQDNGTFLLNNNQWFQVLGGDGMECMIDPNNDDILYGSLQNGSIFRSIDGGINFTSIKPSSELKGAWVTPFLFSKQIPSMIYAAYNNVYRSPDGGSTWEKKSDFSGAAFNSLAVAPSNDDYIYVATYNNIYKTQNGGANWTEITNGLPKLSITSIVVSPNDPNKIWVSLSGYTANSKVYKSINGGTNWNNFSDSLPNLPVNDLVIRFNSNQEIYAATDNGVYYRDASIPYWVNYSKGLPNVIVNELEITESTNLLRAATYGRGIWVAKLPPPVESKAAFTADINKGCVNAPFKFTYTGPPGYDSLIWSTDATDILYQSPNHDTIIVDYAPVGRKTIQLTHYLNDTSTSEVKYQYIDVENSLDIKLSPDKYYVCDSSMLKIYIPQGYSYSWEPKTYIDSSVNNMVYATPDSNITYTVTLSHGTCESVNELPVKFMPDKACSAFILSKGKNGIFSNECASADTNEPIPGIGTGANSGCISQDGWCNGENRIDNSLWFKIIVSDSGQLRINTDGFDSQIALYQTEGCDGLFTNNYTLLAANDDISSTNYNSQINLLTGLTPGDTLYLQVDGSYGGISGEFYINIADEPSAIHEPVVDPISNVKIFPNPASENVTVQMLVTNTSVVNIDVISVSGEIIRSFSSATPVSFYEGTIPMEGLSGLYIIRIRAGKTLTYRKLLVE